MSDTAAGAAGARVALGVALVAVSAMGYGSSPTLARVAYDGGANAITVVLLRFLLGTVVLAPWWLRRGRKLDITARQVGAGVGLGALFVLQGFCYASAVRFIPVGLAALIFFMFPLVVAVQSRLVDAQPVGAVRSAALLGALVGVALTAGLTPTGIDLRGVLLAASGALSAGVFIFFGSRLSTELGAVDFTALTFGSAAVVALLVTAIVPAGLALPVTAMGWTGLLSGGIAYVVGTLSFFKAVTVIDRVHAAIVANVEPLWSILIAWLLLGELLAVPQLLGAVLVVGAVVSASLPRPSPPKPPL